MNIPKIKIIDGKKLSEEDEQKLKEILLRGEYIDEADEISFKEDDAEELNLPDGISDSDKADLFREVMYYENRDRLIRRFGNIAVSLALVFGITSLSRYFDSYWLMFFYILPLALSW